MLCHASLCLLVLGVVSSPFPSGAHPCDTAAPDTFVCDPSTGGSGYFQCMADGVVHTFSCGTPLVFNNAIQSCDWPANSQCVSDSDPAGPGDLGETTTTAAAAASTTTTTTAAAASTTTTTTAAAASTTTTTTTTTATTTTTPRPNSGSITTTTPASYSAGTCNSSTCQLPQCRCVGADIPGNVTLAEVPQMVLLTFDDAVNNNNFHYYSGLYPASQQTAVKNPNGCRAAGTFFVSGAWTNLSQVKTLVNRGNEVASHSQTHTNPRWWDRQAWDREIQGMRQTLATGTGLPLNKIVGMRAPFLELGEEKQFSMLQDNGFLYDSSMFGGSYQEDSAAPLWPFTLAYPPPESTAVCDQNRCPTRSYPQIWEVPLIRQYSSFGSCTMTDDVNCKLPSTFTKDDVKNFLRHNFNRHYTRNRAPFMISLHSTWFTNVPSSYAALKEFLQEVSLKPDVWQVTMTQMLDWVRHPVPLSRVSEMTSWQCGITGTGVTGNALPSTTTTSTTTTTPVPPANGSPGVPKTATTPAQATSAPIAPGTCNPSTCQLPHCRCVGTDIPGKLQVADVPQMVMLTFDDAVNTNNFNYYQRLFPAKESDAVKNPNGCRTAATFFVDGTWTDSTMVKTLSDLGSEMASHSLTHSAPSTWNAQAWDREMQGMREVLANDTGLPLDKVVGMRAPFLQLGGETQFTMLENRDFLYDSSMYGGSLKEDTSPPLWPFTMAYPPKASQLVCDQPNCPARSYPDVWEVPIVRQYNLGGQPCSMTDSCVLGSAPTKDDVKDFLRHNFDRHFKRNRAPFMISLHATWFSRVSNSFEGLKEFLEEISLKPEVWQVTLTQMLDWVRHPLPLSRVKEIPSWQCSQSSQTPSSA